MDEDTQVIKRPKKAQTKPLTVTTGRFAGTSFSTLFGKKQGVSRKQTMSRTDTESNKEVSSTSTIEIRQPDGTLKETRVIKTNSTEQEEKTQHEKRDEISVFEEVTRVAQASNFTMTMESKTESTERLLKKKLLEIDSVVNGASEELQGRYSLFVRFVKQRLLEHPELGDQSISSLYNNNYDENICSYLLVQRALNRQDHLLPTLISIEETSVPYEIFPDKGKHTLPCYFCEFQDSVHLFVPEFILSFVSKYAVFLKSSLIKQTNLCLADLRDTQLQLADDFGAVLEYQNKTYEESLKKEKLRYLAHFSNGKDPSDFVGDA